MLGALDPEHEHLPRSRPAARRDIQAQAPAAGQLPRVHRLVPHTSAEGVDTADRPAFAGEEVLLQVPRMRGPHAVRRGAFPRGIRFSVEALPQASRAVRDHHQPGGAAAAKHVSEAAGELVVFVDDDVRVRPGWLEALLDAARKHPEVDVFTGPIEPRLEGSQVRGCGREGPPITSLNLGKRDTDTRYAWGANMTIRRPARSAY